jgi:hypothetical protein
VGLWYFYGFVVAGGGFGCFFFVEFVMRFSWFVVVGGGWWWPVIGFCWVGGGW